MYWVHLSEEDRSRSTQGIFIVTFHPEQSVFDTYLDFGDTGLRE
jgi:phage terminase large subunit-like protein